MTAIELLADFIERHKDGVGSFGRNEWLNGDDMAVYVRKSVPRYIGDKKMVTLDIASITVYHKGQGNFTKFLAEAEKLNPWPATFVESVLEPRFGCFLSRQGYTQVEDVIPTSFYKMKGKSDAVVEKPVLIIV